MQVTVDLQDMFSYSFGGVFIFILLLLIPLIIFLIKQLKAAPKKPTPTTVNPGNTKNIFAIKNKHKQMLMNIEKNYSENKITDRVAYQELSAVMRLFVYEMTGIQTPNFTLAEIKTANIPRLYELVAEYYRPEFATEYTGNIHNSLEKARKVIDEWN